MGVGKLVNPLHLGCRDCAFESRHPHWEFSVTRSTPGRGPAKMRLDSSIPTKFLQGNPGYAGSSPVVLSTTCVGRGVKRRGDAPG